MYEYKAKITRVVDGDTVDCIIDLGFDMRMKARVRLSGIDTPETRTKDKEEKFYGLLAKRFVEKNLPEGSTCTIRTQYDSKGKYGRILGDFYIEQGLSVNRLLLQHHLAVAYHGQSKDELVAQHVRNRSYVQPQ